MKKWGALLLLLALMASMLVGCGEEDPEKIAARVVAEVDGEQVTRGEAQKVYDFILNQTVMSAAEAGQEVDPTATDVVSSTKAMALGVITEGLALDHKLTELGNGLTDEDRASFATRAQEEYTTAIETFTTSYGMTEAEAKESIDSMGYTEYALEYMMYREELEKRLLAIVSEEVVVTDEQVQAKYDELVASAEATYKDTPAQFITDVLGGNTIYARPEGFRYVKNIVLSFPEDIDALITEKDNEYYTKLMEQYTLSSELSTNTELTEEEKAEKQAQIDAISEDFTRIQGEIEALEAQAFEQMKPDAEEKLAEIKADSANFDTYIVEYSSDTPTGVIQEYGYPVFAEATNYVASFTTGAMALQNVGDVSDLIQSEYGYHILQYASDVTPGPVALDELRDTVTELVKTEQQDTLLTTRLVEWIEAANIKTYVNKF